MAEEKELVPKKVKGRITVLLITHYQTYQIYIRMIGKDLFEYLLIYKNQIYSNYLIISPAKSKKKLTKSEINDAKNLILAGAITTIDQLMEENNEIKAPLLSATN